MKSKSIMIQGTGSSVGKSVIVAGLCRIFKQDGYKVAPFKSQNMALNSFITKEGKEMGRAQVVQAEAAGIEPSVKMNPILLKPTTDKKSQVIINGEVFKNMSAVEYHEFKPKLANMVRETYEKLEKNNDVIVIEGAGSPAEINLRENDIVNMGMAELVDAPVVIVGDIDKGGVFASLAGTMLLLSESEKARVKGVIINKFRGDIKILEPGIKMLEDIIKVPVIGVVPYERLKIEDEDSLAEKFNEKRNSYKDDIDIVIIKIPHISNFTDFNALENIEGVNVRFVDDTLNIGDPDMVILPGSKNTIEDLQFVRRSGLENEIIRLSKDGKIIFGVCGGYQMLGIHISDPHRTESNLLEINGIGLLNINTIFKEQKVTTQVSGKVVGDSVVAKGSEDSLIEGYEIHMGITEYMEGCKTYLKITKILDNDADEVGGVSNEAGNVMGTYIHGIFDNLGFTNGLINDLRRKKGLKSIDGKAKSFKEYKEEQYNHLADILRNSLNMDMIYNILGG